MTRFLYKLLPIFAAGLILLSACSTSEVTPDLLVQEQITQTLQAVATEVQMTLQAVVPPAVPMTNTPFPTNTPLPTATSVPTETPAPSETSIPIPVVAHIMTSTNCRSGPTEVYPVVFVASKGVDVKIVSGTSLNDYVIVENPASPDQTCWLWTKFTEISGDLAGLPVVTPPSSPTPAIKFSTTFIQLEHCTGRSLAFTVHNTGPTTIQSYSIVVTDQTVSETKTTTKNQFGRRESCVVANNIDFLHTGDLGYLYADNYAYDPTGHTMLVYITVCSNNDLGGDCA